MQLSKQKSWSGASRNHAAQQAIITEPPFMCYLLPRSDNFSADGAVYHKLSVVHFEVYTDRKDRVLENRVEDVLDKNNIFYNKSEVWINSEKLYEVIYSFEMEV